MKRLGFVLGFLFMVSPGLAWAGCTAAEIREMIGQGLSDEEIEQRCDRAEEIPGWLSGDWQVEQVIETSNAHVWTRAPRLPIWRIGVGAGTSLTVGVVEDAHLADAGMSRTAGYEVRDVSFSGGQLRFVTRENFAGYKIITTWWELDLSSEQDLVTGRWRSRDGGGMGLPPIEESGSIQMVKRN